MRENMTAEELVAEHLAACLPLDTPPSYRRIVSARFVGTGRKRVAVAELEMFDGQPAKVEVHEYGKGGYGFGGSSHRWLEMEGGNACYWNGRWQREQEVA